jgi:hypothetical protein
MDSLSKDLNPCVLGSFVRVVDLLNSGAPLLGSNPTKAVNGSAGPLLTLKRLVLLGINLLSEMN